MNWYPKSNCTGDVCYWRLLEHQTPAYSSFLQWASLFANINYSDLNLMCIQGYIVLNRPWAFVQWLEKTTIEEE